MNGILIVDKPAGVSSHDVVRQVRRICRQRQVGHAGTLDPMATGVLVVGIGAGTRILQFLMDAGKTYRTTLKLGETTDTQDAEGSVLGQRPWQGIQPDDIEKACRLLVGTIEQVPPMYSALKRDGVPLYKLARQGVEVERQARPITIHRLSVEKIALPFVTLVVDCSKGTYIRTLCHDLGEALGCGAHMTALRRTRSGCFTERDAVADLANYVERPEDLPLLTVAQCLLREFPSVAVTAPAAARLCNGVPPTMDEITTDCGRPEPGQKVVLLGEGAVLAVARFAPQRELETRGDFELLRVFPGAAGTR